MNHLLEINYEAAKTISTEGYKQYLQEEYGIGCSDIKNIDKELLELEYRLDKDIC